MFTCPLDRAAFCRPDLTELAEERQDQRRRLVGDRESLRAELLLDLQRLEAGRFLRQVSVDEVADALFDGVGELRGNSFWISRAAACEPIVASALLRLVIAVSMAFDAVVAAAVDVEMSVEASEDRIEPDSEKSAPVIENVFEPAEETVAVATP
jgi:hypothetical protein